MATTSACVAVYVLKEVHAYVLAESQPDRPTPSPAQCTNTEAGLGQLRYLCGRCIAMSKHATVTRLRRHMYNRMDLYREDTSKLHLLCKLLRSKKAKQGKCLYSSVSSPQDRSKRFTLYFPDRPIHSYTISASLGSIQPYATINARRMLVHISATVHSSFIQLSELEQFRVNKTCPRFYHRCRIRTRVLVVESSKLYS